MRTGEILQRIEEVQVEGGEGSSTWPIFGETRIPSSSDADELVGYDIPLDVDPEIRGLVLNLNRAGYETFGSCAGHHKEEKGFITLSEELSRSDKIEIANILREHGITHFYFRSGKPWTYINFPPIGRRAVGS